MMSKKLWYALAAVLVVALSLSIIGCGEGGEEAAGELTGEYTIVALVPLTGSLGTYGENSKEAALLAAQDVNAWLEEQGRSWRLKVVPEDTQTEPAVALRKMQNWFGDGVRFFSGPQSSGEASECLNIANSNQILFVSQSSTSPTLAIADDWLFRFCTDDSIQGPAIAGVAAAAGVKHLIFAWQGDTWGDGLQSAAAAKAKDLGIEVYPQELRFDPMLEDFTKEVGLLDGYVTDLLEQGVSLDEIGFCIITYEQVVPFMIAASEYPQLREIAWIGSDGTVKSAAMLANETVARFAADTRFISAMNRPEEASRKEHVTRHIQEILGREPDAYAYNNYDIIWALALAIDEVGYDPVKVREILPRVADEWTRENGASGHVVLNEFGDRAFADYDLWLINDDLEWEYVGYYDFLEEVIHWEREVY